LAKYGTLESKKNRSSLSNRQSDHGPEKYSFNKKEDTLELSVERLNFVSQ
jgi:hypothetical protein